LLRACASLLVLLLPLADVDVAVRLGRARGNDGQSAGAILPCPPEGCKPPDGQITSVYQK
jgi:hypothetical protein